jgi:hypothetical protein
MLLVRNVALSVSTSHSWPMSLLANSLVPLGTVRVLRFLAANASIDQVTETTYAPNTATEALGQPGLSAAINHQ